MEVSFLASVLCLSQIVMMMIISGLAYLLARFPSWHPSSYPYL